MRVVLDTHVLISALLIPRSESAVLLGAWRRGVFDLMSCDLQLEEIRQVTRRAKIRALIRPALAGELVNQLRSMTLWFDTLPQVDKSIDPFDNFLLAMVEAGAAHVLVSGDERGVLTLRSHGNCHILTVRQFVAQLGLH